MTIPKFSNWKCVLRNAVMIIALVVSVGAWSYASPVGSDPDGNFHLASIWCGDGFKENQCAPPSKESEDDIPKVVTVPRAVAVANGCRPMEAAYSASCTNELLLQADMTETRYNNAGRLYPNGFYWTASHLVSTNIENSVERVRIMNVLLFVVLLIAVNALLPIELRRSLNTTHVLLLMPLGLFLIASNNPSSWAISGLGTFWAFLYGFLTMTSRLKMVGAAFFTLLSAFMAIQARADSAAFTVVISVVVSGIVIFKNSEMRGQIYRRLLLPLFILIPAFLSFSGSSQSKAISNRPSGG
jgi:hypothetical protein